MAARRSPHRLARPLRAILSECKPCSVSASAALIVLCCRVHEPMRHNAGWMMENDEPTIGFVAPPCRLDSRLAMQNAFVPQQIDGSAARSVRRGRLLCEGARNDDQTSCEK